jgi:hypothetical protein
MVIIRFEDENAERRALAWLAGRFSFRTWANGDLMLHEQALSFLAREGIPFRVRGSATYEHSLPAVRNPAPAAVQ